MAKKAKSAVAEKDSRQSELVAMLLARRNRVLQGSSLVLKAGGIGTSGAQDGSGDDGDLAQGEHNTFMSATLLTSKRAELAAIDAALDRARAGMYGVCEECGEEIPVGRLKAIPFAVCCVDCAREREMCRDGELAEMGV